MDTAKQKKNAYVQVQAKQAKHAKQGRRKKTTVCGTVRKRG